MPAEKDYLAATLAAYPRQPSYALWRAIELRLLSRLQFDEPILDLGCGEGMFARLLLGEGLDLTGIDLDPAVLAQAADRGAYRRVLKADATQLPFPDGSFGSILSNCVLEHIPDDEAVIAEMARVLRPGGMVAITVPGPQLKDCLYTSNALRARGESQKADAYLDEFDRKLAHFHYRTADEWNGIFTAAGLKVDRIEPYLPAAVVSLWDRLDNYLMQPVVNVTSHKKLAFVILTPMAIRNWLTYRFLRKYYLMAVAPGAPHGGWLITARRPAGASA